MVFVSPFEEQFTESLTKATEDLPEQYEELIKDIEDKIWNAVQDKLRDSTVHYLKDNMKDDILQHAAKVAESMISNALAGDDKTLRNLFGFSDWYMKNRYLGEHPREYKLLDMLVERHPDFFVNEKIKQLETDNKALNHELQRLRAYYYEKYEAEDCI